MIPSSTSPDPALAANAGTSGNADIAADYNATQTGVAVIDLSRAGKLEVSGQNAAQFLNGLVTNDVKSLVAGTGCLAAFLNVHGKVLALARIYRREEYFLIELEESNREKILQNLSRFIPAGGFFVKDVSDELSLISVQGPRSAELLSLLMDEVVSPEPFANIDRQISSTRAIVATHARCGLMGFDLFVSGEAAARVSHEIVDAETDYSIRSIDNVAFEIARIEAGIPIEPQDVNEAHILLEAGFENAVSYTKGCYLGQEIIARIHWRGQPAKQLRRLSVEAAYGPPNGTELHAADGKRVGHITSSAEIPEFDGKRGRIVALGYVHRYYLAAGTRFTLKVSDEPLGEAVLV